MNPCVPLSAGPGGSPQQEEQTLFTPSPGLLLSYLDTDPQSCHCCFLSALLAPALFSSSQVISVISVTGREQARLAVGAAEQDVMEAGSGMCSCPAELLCCHPVQGHEQGARVWDGITRG